MAALALTFVEIRQSARNAALGRALLAACAPSHAEVDPSMPWSPLSSCRARIGGQNDGSMSVSRMALETAAYITRSPRFGMRHEIVMTPSWSRRQLMLFG